MARASSEPVEQEIPFLKPFKACQPAWHRFSRGTQ